jgi:hypothetical protein
MAAPRNAARRALWVALGVALLAHGLALGWLSVLLQPPSLLKDVVAPMYTRTLQAEAPPQPVTSPTAGAGPSAPKRPSAVIRTAPAATKNKAKALPPAPTRTASAPADAAPQPEAGVQTAAELQNPATSGVEQTAPQAEADMAAALAQPVASSPEQAAPAASSPLEAVAAASAPAAQAAGPIAAASDAQPAFLETWPGDTRLTYKLSGNYRGELHGNAQVLWQREGTRYQAVVQMDLGLLLSSRFTSQGAITEHGLHPEVYEEQVRQRRRGVRIGEDVRLNNGERVPRPNAVQDAASQFVELGHRFATGQLKLEPGGQVNFWLARPGGVDEWTYDVVGEEALQLPRLGAVQAVHLKPRPLAKPRGSIVAEIWFAPSLQYLPVRIRITQGPDSYVDLLVDAIDQR